MLARLLLILMIPTFLLYTTPIPQNIHASPSPPDLHLPTDPYEESGLTFDQLLSFIEIADNPEAISQLSPTDLDKLSNLMTILAKKGVLPEQENLENEIDADIDDLQAIDQQFAFMAKHPLGSNQYIIDYTQDYELIRCGWLSKKWKKTCKFVRKHKKAIIIGAAVVVAVTVIAVAVVATSSAAATTAAAGAAASAGASSPSASEKKDSHIAVCPKETTLADETNETPIIKTAIDEHISSFKELLVEDVATQQETGSNGWNEKSFSEKAREVGAHFAHKALDEVADLAKAVPQLCQEAKDLGEKILPESLQLPTIEDAGSPLENYENLVAKGHQAIDYVFTTDQAEHFTPEARAKDPMKHFAIGVIPIPGMVNKNGNINTKAFSKLGKAPDRAGFTKAGRASAKHGNREGRTVFKKPVGNPAQINDHGQKVLDNILNHPEKKLVQYTHKMYGPVIDIEAPEIGGVRFTGDGKEMMGFLEPKWLKK